MLDVGPAGVPNILFGFSGAELVGLPLAAVIDVFGLWRHTYGEDNSLLALLAHQALGHSNCAPAAGSSHTGSVSWRVGIHQPVTEEGLIAQHAAKLASAEGNNKASHCSGPCACRIALASYLQAASSQ